MLGYSPLRAGFAYLPFGVAIGASIGISTSLIPRIGLRPVLTTGLLIVAAGIATFSRITPDGSFLTQVLPASLLVALGSGLALPGLGNAAVENVTEDDAGLASGVQQALQQVAGAVGLAVLASLALNRAAARTAAGGDPAAAITDGYRLAFTVGIGLMLIATACAAALLPKGVGTEQGDTIGREDATAAA